jgi:hypothetical protein
MKKKTVTVRTPKDPEIVDLEKEKKNLQLEIDNLRKNIRAKSETILEELEAEKKQLRADATRLKATLTTGNELNNKLLAQIKENEVACNTLHLRFVAKQAELKALSENHDFILPADMTENVTDVTYDVQRINNYDDYEYTLTLHKEITVNRWFKKPKKMVIQQLVRIATSSYQISPSLTNPQYTRMLNYYSAIKKHILQKKMQNDTNQDFSKLLDEANEVIVSPDIHEKDRFLLKLVDELKKL